MLLSNGLAKVKRLPLPVDYCHQKISKLFCCIFFFSDLWGRLENDSGMTASNVAKYDGLHSMVVFKEHPPSHMNKVQN